MLQAPILMTPLPAVTPREADRLELPRPLRETDVSQMQEWMQRWGIPRIGRDTVRQAVDLRAADPPYCREIGKMFLVAMVPASTIRDAKPITWSCLKGRREPANLPPACDL